jgi:hypothetical protein
MLPFGGRALLAGTALPWAGDGPVRPADKAFPGRCLGRVMPQAPHRRGLVHIQRSVRSAAQPRRRPGHARLPAAGAGELGQILKAGLYNRWGETADRKDAVTPREAVLRSAGNLHLFISTMGTARPATRPTLSVYKLRARSFDPARPRLRFLCGLNPTYPLVARDGRNILPCC